MKVLDVFPQIMGKLKNIDTPLVSVGRGESVVAQVDSVLVSTGLMGVVSVGMIAGFELADVFMEALEEALKEIPVTGTSRQEHFMAIGELRGLRRILKDSLLTPISKGLELEKKFKLEGTENVC